MDSPNQLSELNNINPLKGINQEDIRLLHNTFFSEIKTREDVLEFEKEIKSMPTAFDECPYPLFHSFADGMYTREIHFNKGHLIVGAIHKNEYFVNVLKGRIWVVSEFGAKEIIAPASFTAKAGVKHIGFTLEDTVWSDTHKVESTNVEDAEKEIFVDSYDGLNGEYLEMCDDIGISHLDIKSMSEIDEGIICDHNDAIEVRKSPIEGLGVFLTEDIAVGQVVTIARIGDKRTLSGRYVNHSNKPNVVASVKNGDGVFISLCDIPKGAEIVADYRDVIEKSKTLDGGAECLDG